jgi:alpha-amylase
LENLEDSPARISFAPEFNFAFSYFEEKNSAELSRVREWSYKDEVFGVNLKVQLSEDARVWVFPVQTVSLSESGFEKTYQGTAVVPIFELELPAHGKHEIEISLKPHKH